MNCVGHLWQLRWFNPHGQHAGPEVLAEIFIPVCHKGQGAGRPPAVITDFPAPAGYCLACMAVSKPLVPKNAAQLAKIRRQHLSRRVNHKAPLFAAELIERSLTHQPDYYAGVDNRAARAQILKDERETFERLMALPNVLFDFREAPEERT